MSVLKKVVQLSNDMIDKHGDRMTIEALKSAETQTNSKVIISHNEHDFSYPPIGRMDASKIIHDNGINILLGEFALFEPEDIEKENLLGDRELAVHQQESGKIRILCDRAYHIDGLMDDVNQLQELFDSSEELQFELKKSLEPISTLTLLIGIGGFVSVGFLNGFLGEAGKDAWASLKALIKKKKQKSSDENHVQFIFDFRNEFYKVEIMVIFKNPSDQLDQELKLNQEKIESKVIQYYESSVRAGRIVFLADESELRHIYSVYKCGTPFDIANKQEYLSLLKEKNQQMPSHK
jgi:hypothetical protein